MQLYPTKPMKCQVNVIGATYRPSYTHFCSGMHDLKKRKHVPAGIRTQDLLNTSQTLAGTCFLFFSLTSHSVSISIAFMHDLHDCMDRYFYYICTD